MTAGDGEGTSWVRAGLPVLCGAVLILGSLNHFAMNLTGAHTSHLELLAVYTALVAAVAFASLRRAHRLQRTLYLFGIALAMTSVLAPLATPDPTLQRVERGITVALLLGYSLRWATTPLRRALRGAVDAARFGVGLFVADQLAAYGIGGVILTMWPDLAFKSWPLSIVGELVQEGCLLLVLTTYALAAPAFADARGPRLPPGRGWIRWRPIVIAALQVEFGVIVFQLLLEIALQLLCVDLGSIGNAVFPAPGDWQPSVPVALLLLAVLPGVVEELVFRGVIFGALHRRMPLAVAMAISSGLFGLAHLSPDMDPANMASVFLHTFVFGCLAAIAYQRTGSLYVAIVAHALSDTGPALAVVLPHEAMQWVFLVTLELSLVGTLPAVFSMFRRQQQRWTASVEGHNTAR